MNDINEIEKNDESIVRLLGELERVEAPVGFETRVMARIAERERATVGSGLSLGLGYALPLVLVLLIGGFLVYLGFVRGDSPQIARPAPSQIEAAPMQDAMPPVSEPDQFARVQEDTQSPIEPGPQTSAERSMPTRIVRATASPVANSGGSFEKAAEPDRILLPPGVSSRDPLAANRAEVITTTDVPVRDVLSLIGITADFEGGWKVQKLAANSLAERSGVKVGDIVSAIDNKTLAADTQFSGDVSAKTITVNRGGSTLVIALKPN